MRSRDALFVVHPDVPRKEFQYALRSLDFIDHGTVWVLGGKPDWLINVRHLPLKRMEKWKALTQVWHDIVGVEELTSEFIYTEDDYFITEPVDDIPNYTHPQNLNTRTGSGGDSRGKGGWCESMKHTRDILVEHGIEDPHSFDVHIPMIVEKDLVPIEWDDKRGPLRFRSLIGNTSTQEPTPIARDVKCHRAADVKSVQGHGIGFLSSAYKTFPKGVEPVMRELFPEPCRYEKEYYVDSEPDIDEETPDEVDDHSDTAQSSKCAECGKFATVESVRNRRKPPHVVEVLTCGHRRARG